MSSQESKINGLLDRLKSENSGRPPIPDFSGAGPGKTAATRPHRPSLGLEKLSAPGTPVMRRPQELVFSPKRNDNIETDRKLKEIMKISGMLKIRGETYITDIKDMEHIEELGNGTCGHVVKMRHLRSGEVIAVKQMRRSGNSEENKRIIMDIEVVIKSHDCQFIVQCLGCFITDAEVWICMELMNTCFDKLLKRVKQAIPESVIGKVTVATVKALSYLKEKHGVIHRDVKPSNILLDELGNVKLCDFGISGRLVDSMAKTRSAGCAAYMAPERIEPDPNNPDYDIRADVWSLGITLVELATGVFPYQDCKTDFEVLTKVIGQDPPTLPVDGDFSPEFRQFVSLCLTKDPKQRPKYIKLQNEPFIKGYETATVNVGEWFQKAMQQADLLASKKALPRHSSPLPSSTHRPLTSHQRPLQQHFLINGSSSPPPLFRVLDTNNSTNNPFLTSEDVRPNHHVSRYATFHNTGSSTSAIHQRDSSLPYLPQQSSASPPVRGYSPYRTYQGTVQNAISQYNHHLQEATDGRYSPKRLADGHKETSPYFQRRYENRWNSHGGGSPTPPRTHPQTNQEQVYNSCTSPIVLQRFCHLSKAQDEEDGREEPAKRKFASYIKMQLTGDKSGRSSRHQSPEPPPRLNRHIAGDSPLAIRRNNFLESTNLSGSPSLSRRFVSPTPPVPPPRRLSESSSVPGSPQNFRARFHYTPEPQRHVFHNNDISSS